MTLMALLGRPSTIRGGRFCRTLDTASFAVGTPAPQTPTEADPFVSITKLASPVTKGRRLTPVTSNPPTSAVLLKPPVEGGQKQRGRSLELTVEAAEAGMAADPTSGSVLPTCRWKTVRPFHRAQKGDAGAAAPGDRTLVYCDSY